MSGLGETIQHYPGSLDTLGTRVASLHAQAVHSDAAMAIRSA
jgi:hypothetical protein